MRQTVGNTFIIKLVIIFTLLFSAFLALAITYNKIFKMKNEVVSIVEKYEGVNTTSTNIIKNYFDYINYRTTNYCPNSMYDNSNNVYGITSDGVNEMASQDKKYLMCYYKTKKSNTTENVRQYVYNVVVFYKFDLPVLGDLATFAITGQTKAIIE